jgi:hypothetical protein
MWKTTSGTPSVTVGSNPGDTYSTIEAALAAIGTLGGGIIDVDPGFSETTANQLVVQSNTWLRSWQGGGEVSGPTLIAPRSTITSTYAGSAVLLSNVSKVRITGLSLASAQAYPTLEVTNKARHNTIEDNYIVNSSGNALAPAILVDGVTANTEHQSIHRNVFIGDPPIGIGVNGEAGHANDTHWDDNIAEGPSFACGTASNAIVKVYTQGGNHHFRNLYSRGSFAAGQSLFDMGIAAGGSLYVDSGELLVGPGNVYIVGGGTLTISNTTITNTGGPSIGVIVGGQLELFNITQQTGTFQHNQISGGVTMAGDRMSQILGTWNWGVMPTTTLNGTITAGATSLVVTSSSGFPATPFVMLMDQEYMNVTNVAGTTWTVTRGYMGSTAAAHTTGANLWSTTGGSSTNAGTGASANVLMTSASPLTVAWPADPGSTGNRTPSSRTNDLNAGSVITSGNWFQVKASSGPLGLYVLTFVFTSATTTDTCKFDLSPDNGTTIYGYFPATAIGVANAKMVVTVICPGSWYVRYTGAGTGPTLSTQNVFAYST